MSAISLKSITGITSITTPAGVDNIFTVHTNDTTERFRVDSTGNLNIAGIVTVTKDLDVDGHTNLDNVSIAGISTFSGNVNITNTNPKLFFYDTNNDSDYAIVNNGGVFRINDETNSLNRFSIDSNGNVSILKDLDVDGHTNLDNVSIAGVTTFSTSPVVPNGGYYKGIINSGSQQKIVGGYISGTDTLRLGESMYLTSTGLGINESSPSQRLHVGGDVQIGFNTPNDAGRQINFNVNRSSAGQTLANINWQWNNKFVAQIRGIAGSDTTNKDDAHLAFFTSSANNLTARLRIHPDGGVTIGDIASTTTKAGILHTRVSTTTRPVVFENDTENSDVVIKTTGTNKHSILGFGDGASNFAGNIDYDHQNNAMVFDTNGGERLNISSSGVITQVETGTGNGHGGIKASTASGGGNAGFGFITAGTQRFNVTTIGSAGSEALRVYDNNNSLERLRVQSTGVVNIGDTTASSLSDRLLQIGKTNRSATYLELRTSTSGVGGIVLSDGTANDNTGYRGTIEYVHNGDYLLFKTAASERLRINNEGALSVQTTLTGNNAILYLNNKRTRADGNKYGIEFRDNNNEANANIVIEQNASGNNAAEMQFYMNGGTGGNGLQNGNHTLRLQQSGDVQIPTGNLNFRTLSSSPAQAAPASINMGGTHSNAAGNGTNLNAKLKVWSDGTDMMGLSVSSNQLDYIVTQEVYDHVWYGGNSGTSELMRLEGDGDLILTNGNKFNINAASAAGQGGALINIGWDGGTNIATKAIDIGGGWSAGENKRITFSHSTGSNNLVGEINSIHYGGTPSRTSPHSGLRFGKLYHANDSTTFTMTLDSTSTTTADLNLKGAYRSTKHPAFSASASGNNSNLGSLTKLTYAIAGTGAANNDGFDTTNNRFVAPVDGFYHFYARHWFTPGYTGTAWLYFFRNGSQVKECRLSLGSSAGEYNTMQLSTTLYLSATNFIEVYAQGSGSSQFHPSNGSFHTEFSGYLVC